MHQSMHNTTYTTIHGVSWTSIYKTFINDIMTSVTVPENTELSCHLVVRFSFADIFVKRPYLCFEKTTQYYGSSFSAAVIQASDISVMVRMYFVEKIQGNWSLS